MENQFLEVKKGLMNAVVFMDYENITELIKQYGKDPLEIDFFRVVQNRLKDQELNIVDFIVYSNFEKKSIDPRQQSFLQAMGIQTRHTSNNGKNSSDLELTVDALRALYKNPNIDVFVFISSGRDIIPLLKAIKYENKVSYALSTRNGFNQVVAEYADVHEYIEEIFKLTPEMLQHPKQQDEVKIEIDLANIKEEDIERAKEVSKHFYNSHIWRKSTQQDTPINLKGYINVISRVVNRFSGDILNDFKTAHCLKYVTIYQDQDHRLCLKEGERMNECVS
ncbi:MAG: NYN domain-containing protein [Firmicutes bacterium]|nr:NYN domain-containing protein [Bacillota bacterium]